MWCKDVGLVKAANMPLMRIVFQVMMQLIGPRKIMLLFVMRDIGKANFEVLAKNLREDVQKTWNSVDKPQKYKDTLLDDIFRMEFVALSSYDDKEKQFKKEVKALKERFFYSFAPKGLDGDTRGDVPISEFAHNAEQIWKIIKEEKQLNLPAHWKLMAELHCGKIVNEKLFHLSHDKNWHELEREAELGVVHDFGKRAREILNDYLSRYDQEAQFIDKHVSSAMRQQLEFTALDVFYRGHQSVLGNLHSRCLTNFKNRLKKDLKRCDKLADAVENCAHQCWSEFNAGYEAAYVEPAKWDPTEVKNRLIHDMNEHVELTRKRLAEKEEMMNAIGTAAVVVARVVILLGSGGMLDIGS